ncbi:MAG: class II aldolase [Betaproteobacteria bacterium]|nr:class II aldolase [Betaproteobacteria bacterium]
MKMSNLETAAQLRAYCARIGADPLLVQGAGGNASWKDGGTLWVKASGTWLADAEINDIFVPADLTHLRRAITNSNYSVTPKVVGSSNGRPSIETLLHALMPHKVVVHLHAVEILAHLVRENPIEDFKKLIGDSIKWVCVDYFKPGADLAEAVAEQLATQPDVDVVFLRSHGLVIGGEDVERIESTLCQLLSLLKNRTLPPSTDIESATPDSTFQIGGYVPCGDKEVNQLAIKDEFVSRLQTEWALYPDQVVFLGGEAAIIGRSFELSDLDKVSETNPPYVFSIGKGVYESLTISAAQKAQLRCYYDVLVRQEVAGKLTSLNNDQIASLLSWDAERYRKIAST